MKIYQSIFLFLLSTMILSGCSGTVYVAPPTAKVQDIKRAHIFNGEYDKVWFATVDWFADNNIIIDKLDKESGLLSAKYNIGVYGGALDCGQVDVSTLASITNHQQMASLNVTVRKIAENETRVTVNIAGNFRGSYYDHGWEGTHQFSGQCVSTGMIEESVHKYISRQI